MFLELLGRAHGHHNVLHAQHLVKDSNLARACTFKGPARMEALLVGLKGAFEIIVHVSRERWQF